MNILDKIVAHKHKEILKIQDQQLIKRSPKSLIQSLDQQRLCIISEIKRGSPSKGIFAENLDVEKQVHYYNTGAACISVLTDQAFFHGGFDFLRQVRQLTDLPLLCKDFIIDERQINCAYNAGADLILLIKKILTVDKLHQLMTYAHSLGMEVLIEVDSLEDFRSIEHLPFQLTGINNRNLEDFSIDFSRTSNLAPYIKATGRYVISESGISSKEDALKLRGHIDGLLVGEALIRNQTHNLLADLKVKKKKLKVKICGIQTLEEALAIDGIADMIGLVFCQSERRVTVSQAVAIRKVVKKSKLVGVFMNQSSEEIQRLYEATDLDYVQIHGKYVPLGIADEQIIHAIPYTHSTTHPTLLIIDGRIPGSGQTYDTKHLIKFDDHPYFLAGGLSPANVKDRILASACLGVDVSSGVEVKGKKSIPLMLEFINIVGGI